MTPPFQLVDRYVVKMFLQRLIFTLLAAAVIFIIVDLVEKLDTFIDKDAPYWVVLRYYGYYVPYILYLVLPVGVLLATLFTVGSLSRAHELTAMKASGIGLHRLLWHLLFLGLLFSGWNFLFGETVVPYTTKRAEDIYRYDIKQISQDKASRRGDIYLRNRPGELVHIKYFDAQKNTVFNLDWQRYTGVTMRQRIFAQKALWKNSSWVADKGKEWFFSGDSIALKNYSKRTFHNLGFVPEDLMKVQTDPEEMDYWQLDQFVKRLKIMGGDPVKWSVELAFKTSMPWTCAIVVLLGIPIAAHYRRAGVTLAFGIGLLVSFLFFALQQIGKVMGFNGVLPPQAAAWIGNFVFIIVGILLYWKVEK